MHVVAGFESVISAQGAAIAVMDAASGLEIDVSGGALARSSYGRGFHVDPLTGLDLPEHLFGALDCVIGGSPSSQALAPGQTALVMALTVDERRLAEVVQAASLDQNGALWVRLVAVD
jgi:hypothetical protein